MFSTRRYNHMSNAILPMDMSIALFIVVKANIPAVNIAVLHQTCSGE